jgi:hypothetical protein
MNIRIDTSPSELAFIIRNALAHHHNLDPDKVKLEYDADLPGVTLTCEYSVKED